MASEPLLVVALDFGTTYSGFAYSFRTDYLKCPTRVFSQNFVTDSIQSSKVPTSVLFDAEKVCDCFGQEAEDKYARMCEEEPKEAMRWYYFERFKMKLHRDSTLTRDTVLPDQTKKKGLPALDVFSAAIEAMKSHLLHTLFQRGTQFKKSEIKWVLTIPAIWDDNAKNFMREAAERAGIPRDSLELVLEPEAASVSCLEYNKAHQTLSKDVSLLQPGTKFMMVDCGGGTIDISVFELRAGNTLRHLHRPEGCPDGGTKVDEAFSKFIFQLVGLDGSASIDRMQMLELRREFEKTKRTNPKSDRVAISVPSSVEEALDKGISESKNYLGRVSTIRDKLMIDLDIYKSFFNESATSITKYIQTLLDDEKVGRVDAILLAGGFSESDIIQDAVRKAFSRDRVLVAPSPSAAVLIGAVMLGHNPTSIATRISAYTYGIACTRPFEEGVHDPAKKMTNDHGVQCMDCFDIYVRKDEEVEVNKVLPYQFYNVSSADQKEATISIYKSIKESPVYIDEEGCEKIGSMTLPMPNTRGGKERRMQAAMMVGGTELKLIAKDETTKTEAEILCDFLSKTASSIQRHSTGMIRGKRSGRSCKMQ